MIVLRTAKEIDMMRKACQISAEALQLAGESVKPGITTYEIDQIAYRYIKKQGAEPNFLNYNGFPATACISINDEVIHGIPSRKRVLKEGDIVSIDLGAKVNGYNGDNAATFACGVISDEAKRLCDTTRESLYLGIEQAVAGNRIGDIAFAIQSYCEERGFSVVREYTGHGVGTHLHEDPSVPNYGTAGRGQRLLPGMTIAIEPMINMGSKAVKCLPDGWTVKTLDGKLSAHFEHTIAITKGEPLILTKL
ncbi:MAG: type I methionyl aminopeptidase [Clostridia bacterium]|nr:type I methionyl aminopeptidase [Clostridia bacterium]MBR2953800.1 type I methionyl aminopeptidase [Clostridia bacterium]